MRSLLGIAVVTGMFLIPAEALGVPVNPAPVPSATFDGAVHAVAFFGEVVYVGGEFTHATVDGRRVPRSRLAAIDAESGELLGWAPSADAPVTELAVDASGVYAAGLFGLVNEQERDGLAKLDGRTGALLPVLRHRIYGRPQALALGNGRVYLGGSVTSVDGVGRGYVAAFDAMTGALDRDWAPSASGPVFDILAGSDRVYLAGKFDDVDGAQGTQKIAAVDPDTAVVDRTFTSRVHAFVTALFLAGDTLYAGIDGRGGRAAAMDLSGGVKWTVTTDGDVQAITRLDDTVYFGGHFDNVCRPEPVGTLPGVGGSHCLEGAVRRVKVAAVGLDGRLLPWTADASGVIGVRALAASPTMGRVAVGGYFRYFNGSSQRRFALLRLPGPSLR